MNTMTAALISAGVPVPSNKERVWRDIKAYYTDMEVYTKQPMPKASKPSIKLVDKSRPVGNVPDETPPKKPQGFDIDNLTIAEARALYQRLHKMFGETK